MEQASPSKESDNNSEQAELPESSVLHSNQSAGTSNDVKSEEGETFDCRYCTNSFHTDADRQKHEHGHRPVKSPRYKCDMCSENFPKSCLLKRHRNSHFGGKPFKQHTCDICLKEFTRKDHLKRHIKNIHLRGKSKETFECKICKQVLSSKSSLQVHECRHMDTLPYQCDICSREFARKDHMKRHIKTIHSPGKSKETFECKVCQQVLSSKSSLQVHESRHTNTSDSLPYRCRYCNSSFAAPSELAQHKVIHTRGKTFTCEYCGDSFSQKGTLMVHDMEKHMDEKTLAADSQDKNSSKKPDQSNRDENVHKCEICNEEFASEADLKKHMLRHSESSFSCTVCSKKCNTVGGLRRHIQHKHSGHGIIECETCRMNFAEMSQLKEHQLRHQGNCMPFKCNDCDATFKNNQGLQKHQVVHSSKSFKCDRCDKAFLRFDNLRRHQALSLSCKADLNQEYKCHQCNAVYQNKGNLEQHLTEHHEKVFKCKTCQQIFKDLENLKKHDANKSLCAKYLAAQDSKEDEVYKCNDCRESFDDIITLGVHNCQGVENIHKCGLCQMSFDNSESFREHETKHLKEKSTSCTELQEVLKEDQQLLSSENLKDDELPLKEGEEYKSHEDSKVNQHPHKIPAAIPQENLKSPYLCSVCQKAFDSFEECSNHEKLHTPESSKEKEVQLFTCGYCCETFKSKISLKTHMDSHLEPEDDEGRDDCSSHGDAHKSDKLNKGRNQGGGKQNNVNAKSPLNATPKKGTSKPKAVSPSDSDMSVTKTRTGRKVVTPARFRHDVVMTDYTESDSDDLDVESESDGDLEKAEAGCSDDMPHERIKAVPRSRRKEKPALRHERFSTQKEKDGKEPMSDKTKRESTRSQLQKQTEGRIIKSDSSQSATSRQSARRRLQIQEEREQAETSLDSSQLAARRQSGRGFQAKSTVRDSEKSQEKSEAHTDPFTYRCELCPSKFSGPRLLQKHKIVHTRNANFSCAECTASFNYKRHLIEHQRVHSDDFLHCTYCPKIFLWLDSYNRHIQQQHMEKGEKLLRPRQSNGHQKPGNAKPKKAGISSGRTSQKKQRDDTIQVKVNCKRRNVTPLGTDATYYKCKFCPTSFHTQLALEKHQGVHSVRTESLKDHEQTHEHKTGPLKESKGNHPKPSTRVRSLRACKKAFVYARGVCFPCHYCKRSFRTVGSLVIHENQHKRENKFHCQYCPKILTSKRDVINHKQCHSEEKPHQCRDCKERFTSTRNLKIHVSRCHKRAMFQCQYCAKGFTKKASVRRHELIHTQEKPFPCQYCKEKFTYNRSLKIHVCRKHKGMRFVCWNCAVGFPSKAELTRHRSQHKSIK